MQSDHVIFDRALLRRRLARVLPGAEDHDFLLRRVAEDFEERLALVKRNFTRALNLGAHNGVLTRMLTGFPSVERVVETVPIFPGRRDGRWQVAADEEALPFAEESFDLVISGLVLQSVNDLPGTLAQLRRILMPDGLMLVALLGGETLKELRSAWLSAEEELTGGASPRVAPFADVRQLGGLLQRAGLALPVADSDTVSVTYATPLDLMRELKAMGASNALNARRRLPVTRGLLLRAAEVYAERFGVAGGRIPATFEIVTLTAWAPHESQPKPLRPGSATARLADALATKERLVDRAKEH